MTLAEFLADISSDAAKLWAYRQDPEGVVAASDMSVEDKEILLSGDEARIREAMGIGAEIHVIIIILPR